MASHPDPEIMRLSLSDLALRIKIMKVNLGTSIEDVLSRALDPPLGINIQRAVSSLVEVCSSDMIRICAAMANRSVGARPHFERGDHAHGQAPQPIAYRRSPGEILVDRYYLPLSGSGVDHCCDPQLEVTLPHPCLHSNSRCASEHLRALPAER